MSRLLPLVAYSTFAIFMLALLATPTNALSGEPHIRVGRGHDSIAKRRRNPVKRAKRCRPKSASLVSSSAEPTSTPAAPAVPATTAPETTKAQSTPAPVSTPASSGGSHKKLLLAWPNGDTDLEKYAYGTNVAGLYSWGPWKPRNADALGIKFFPMLWGFKQEGDFKAQVSTDNCGLIFGMNEPNQDGQSDMSAAAGATLWNTLVRPLKEKGCQLVSPATTSAPSGKKWMQDMINACGGDCGFDYIGIHWYGTSISEFKAYVDDFYATFGKPLIISEYACQNFAGGAQCSKDETNTFHYTMAAWFDNHPGVHMYAPFGFMHDMVNVNYDNQLMGSDGSPNDLGKYYLYH